MFLHTLRRRLSALGAVLGLSIALPLATGATPAHAVANLHVTKSHTGNFVRGGQGVYHIVMSNTGTATTGPVTISDNYPQGLTLNSIVDHVFPTGGSSAVCDPPLFGETGFVCVATFAANSAVTLDITLDVAPDAPCGVVTNTITVSEPAESILTSASDPTTITGNGCGNGDGGDGDTSILPVNVDGVVTAFNNTSTNNNLLSPGGTNTTNQNLGINAP
ncbi:hypothetical protein ACFTWH_12265 [Streptomyces sp. NPDC057011]|uniref:hypothetical protein n=1 Tax=unclassified Streptomyces TaxID=2593676 RepID=UPI003633A4E5